MFGGGIPARPGEVSLAHDGVLYLDDVASFSRKNIEMLLLATACRQASVLRFGVRHVFPANALIVGGADPYADESKLLDEARIRALQWHVVVHIPKLSAKAGDLVTPAEQAMMVEQVATARRVRAERGDGLAAHHNTESKVVAIARTIADVDGRCVVSEADRLEAQVLNRGA